MIACEYIFKEFNSLESDEYLDRWASHVDQMAEEGWEILECVRRPGRPGLWTVSLCRSGKKDSRCKLRHDLSEGHGDCDHETFRRES
jgi:hypothetical protein